MFDRLTPATSAGTGKTLAFLVPSVENLFNRPPAPRSISVLVIAPTRELAFQISSEAEKLLRFHRCVVTRCPVQLSPNTSHRNACRMRCMCIVGGTKKGSEEKKLMEGTDILVATPGRLQDHIENLSGFSAVLAGLRVLVLDEADQMLDMGFRPAIEKICISLPKQKQTLLFSATVPPPGDINPLSHATPTSRDTRASAPGSASTQPELRLHRHRWRGCRCIHQRPSPPEVHDHSNREPNGGSAPSPPPPHPPLPLPLLHVPVLTLPILQAVLSHMRTEPQFKIIAFFVSARGTQFHSELFNAMGIPVLEIHSRKSQAHRTRVSDQFRSAASAIMFSSDVSARGVDYPDVTLVIQVGVPADKSQCVTVNQPPPHLFSCLFRVLLQIHSPSRPHSTHRQSRPRPPPPHAS
jgi:ATP-dependent RNA helicase MSS116